MVIQEMDSPQTEHPETAVAVVDGKQPKKEKIGQEQIHNLLFGEQLSWQAIMYDLINTEQLDPWDIDLSVLSQKYLERVRTLEEANFFVSSKVLLAASLLLRIKSEILLNHELPGLDNILFGKKEQKKYVQERIELDDEIPDLIPRTPLPRFRKVTLQELMSALGQAINTENRRIRKVVTAKQQEIETAIALPKRRINLQGKIREIYGKLKTLFSQKETKVKFSDISGNSTEERISNFIPLLHLDNQHKVFLEQDQHFEEIYIWLKHLYEKENRKELEKMRAEVEEAYNAAEAAAEIEEQEIRAAESNDTEEEQETIPEETK